MKIHILLFCAIALIQITPMNAAEKVKKHPARDDVTGVDGEDKELLAAQRKAQESPMQFIKAIQKPEEGKRYLLKVKLSEGKEIWTRLA